MRSIFKIIAMSGMAALAPALVLAQDATTFGDWQKQCEPTPDGRERCYLVQTVQAAAGAADKKPVMVVIVAYSPKRDRVALMIDVPLGMHIPTGLEVSTAGAAKKAEFEQCLVTGCRALVTVDDLMLNALKRGDATSVTVRGPTGDTLVLPISANGFAQAFEKL